MRFAPSLSVVLAAGLWLPTARAEVPVPPPPNAPAETSPKAAETSPDAAETSPAAVETPPPAPAPAAVRSVTAGDFGCLLDWPAVGNTRFHSLAGPVEPALSIARGERPGPFPPGTIVQLMPTEAMVKLSAGASPDTDDWEYLKLKVGKKGVTIAERGGAEVKNIAGSCHGCHTTEPRWDHVCAADHGCDDLPGFVVKAALKAVAKDPRCR